jgi:hypothetical protein
VTTQLQFLLISVAGWMSRHQQAVIEYLVLSENSNDVQWVGIPVLGSQPQGTIADKMLVARVRSRDDYVMNPLPFLLICIAGWMNRRQQVVIEYLQVNTNLATTNWVAPAESVTDHGTIKFIIVNPPTGSRFYRLKNPQTTGPCEWSRTVLRTSAWRCNSHPMVSS